MHSSQEVVAVIRVRLGHEPWTGENRSVDGKKKMAIRFADKLNGLDTEFIIWKNISYFKKFISNFYFP